MMGWELFLFQIVFLVLNSAIKKPSNFCTLLLLECVELFSIGGDKNFAGIIVLCVQFENVGILVAIFLSIDLEL